MEQRPLVAWVVVCGDSTEPPIHFLLPIPLIQPKGSCGTGHACVWVWRAIYAPIASRMSARFSCAMHQAKCPSTPSGVKALAVATA